MNKTIENIESRRSIRKYRPEQIKKEELDAILEAGTYAPNGRGMQKTILVAVQDKAVRDKISKLNAAVMDSDADPFYGAPTVVVVFSDTERPTYIHDGSAVICTLLDAAHSVGVGSCWIHRAKESFESAEGKALKKEWGIPDSYEGVGNCILGYGDGDLPEAKPRREGRIIIV